MCTSGCINGELILFELVCDALNICVNNTLSSFFIEFGQSNLSNLCPRLTAQLTGVRCLVTFFCNVFSTMDTR